MTLQQILNTKPSTVRVYGRGQVAYEHYCFTPVGMSVNDIRNALADAGYVRRDTGQGYCSMSVFTMETEHA